ncbi:ATP-binding protein [Streptomyces antarcticus]|uniref:ATP-binding protein n=1 Tax=Streptomyces antarcticus TaxID=2996458 RepID=UPI0022AE97DC|nr:ATP-binding protein [Streptomyces sp. H34-S5]MCZ4081821.1 ATP-binding protein [Streptomyces sp. H34-S5]
MDIDPTQPWGIAIDYAGRATVSEAGHTIHVRVYDAGLGSSQEPDPVNGYPAVYVTAQVAESGGLGAQLRGSGQVVLEPPADGPVTPDPTAVAAAVAASLTDFAHRATAYRTLCATWPTTP